MDVLNKFKHLIYGPEISIFHEFHKPPYGGGNQFLIALEKELKRMGHDVGRNKIGNQTKACLFNSFNFDFARLSPLKNRFHPKMIHRVDGPVSVYRGTDQKIDREIWEMNHKLADQTIFQSQYSLNKHLEMGLEFISASVIPNAADQEIFNRNGRISPPDKQRKIKLIATSWSSNKGKGASYYEYLDKNLDYSRFEFTFLGNSPYTFIKATHIKPLPSGSVANMLKSHDIYVTASQNDPCSNALIEGLACGLPAVYLNSGGHPELVKTGGEMFTGEDNILEAINQVASNYGHYQNSISVSPLKEVAEKYLEVFNS